MTTPRLVLVHGAWHGSWAWDPLLPALRNRGLRADTVDLRSAGGDGDLAADAEVVRAAVSGDGPVIAVGHSYGGVVISEACAGVPDVVHLVYVCAFQIDVGDSLLGSIGNRMPPWTEVDEASRRSTVTTPTEVFYGDVPTDLAEQWSAKLTTQTLASFEQAQTGAAWRDVTSSYVVCTNDRAIPRGMQLPMAERATKVHTLESSHSPFASHPDALAGILASTAARN